MFRLSLEFDPFKVKVITVLSVIFFIAGVAVLAAYNSAVDYTNSLSFCANTCHEMSIPYGEYQQSKHYHNSFGVRVTCPDCHVPHDKWTNTLFAKILALHDLSDHLFGHMSGVVDTKEQFEKDRLEMAKKVWARMKEDDSRECRNCHAIDALTSSDQKQGVRGIHLESIATHETCIDCHKGLTHKPVHTLAGGPATAFIDIQ